MAKKPTYEELEKRVKELEKAEAERKKPEEDLRQGEKKLREIKRILENRVETVGSPGKSLADLEATDLVGIETLKELNEAFADAFDVCLLLTDANGEYITGPTNLCEFCQIVRCTEKGLKRCKANDTVLAKKAQKSVHPVITRCSNIGFIDAVVPVHIGERHVASWLVGQLCPPEVDEKRVRQCALEIGADEQELLAAYDKMKSRPLEELENALELLAVIARRLSEYGINNRALASEIISHKQMEEALRKSEALLKEAQRVAHVGHWELGPDIGTPVWSDEIFRIFGLDPDEGEPSFADHEAHLHPEDWPILDEAVRRAGMDGTPFDLVFRIVKPDGELGWMNAIGTTSTDEEGNVTKLFGTAQDITVIKKAETALGESQENLSMAQEVAHIGSWKYHVETGELYWSDELFRIYGLDPEETKVSLDYAIGMIHPDDKKFAGETFSKAMKDGFPYDIEYRIIRPNGEERFVQCIGKIEKDQIGDVLSVFGTGQDITDRKQAEESLQKSEEKYRTLLDSIEEIYFEVDIAGNFTFFNDSLSKSLGYSDDELMGMNNRDYMSPESAKKIHTLFSQIYRTGNPIKKVTHEIIRKDGSRGFHELFASLMKDQAGQPIGFRGIAHDITERTRAEEALRTSEAQLSNAMNIAQLGYWEYDVANDLFIFNDHFYAIFRTSAEKVGGYKMSSAHYAQLFVHPDDMAVVGLEIQKALETTNPNYSRQFEHRMIYADGEIGYLSVRFFIVKDDQGRTVKTYGANQDITERKQAEKERTRLEAQLQQARKMETIGLLAGGVAHDLNNILSGIVGYPDLLLLDLPKDSPIREPIEVIKESGQRAADVVSDLLTIARGIASDRRVSNLNSLVKEYLSSPEHKKLEITHPSIAFETVLESELLNISCSPVHIKKSLMNLVTNASEAIEGIGTVTISTMNRYLDEPLKGYEDVRIGEYAVLSVSDDGTGISHEDLERIFEPFYTKKIMGRVGTGLGLAVVWNTVQDHNGYINVRTSEKGTVFELYFSITREEAAAVKEEVEIEDYLGHGEKILILDDEHRQREIASGMLTRLGYTAESVSSGEEGIEYVKEKPVDLIVLDMVMPKGINGRKTYEEIIKIRPGQKAIIASGFSETEDVKIAQRLGAGKYIKKPYTLEKIGLAVKEELDK
ncbi:MAG: two-component system, cell cycle sensor histidine kinase and response regulator CckA [Thermodesulfobacteriota bacterium]|nr:two-component system, cell cycle sensor histidine kinase and response regulator CckA [Thermodesulfobacteriota bacterium]